MRANLRLALATATAAALTGGLLGVPVGTAAAAGPGVKTAVKTVVKAVPKPVAKPAKYANDFNGDGIRDFAGPKNPGRVVVSHGTAKGGVTWPREFDQSSPGIPGKPSQGEMFGDALASADFNRDGYADLAVGDPSETVGGVRGRGAVTIVWGSGDGLGSKATLLPVAKPRKDGYFGMGLAAGDFSGDGKADLAVSDADSVHVYRGGFSSKSGTTGKVTRHRPPGSAKDFMPARLVAGKVTGDKTADLYAVGLDVWGQRTHSAAWFLKGGTTVKNGAFVTFSGEPNYAMRGVVADFDKDGYGDLALNGAQHQAYTGALTVLEGGSDGPAESYTISQATEGVATDEGRGDLFGDALSAGDTNGDAYPDLAVSASGEKVGGAEQAGGVHILRGGKKGLTGVKSQWFTQSTAGVPGDAQEYAFFGEYTRLRDLDGDRHADLLVSDTAGRSTVLKGGATGITAEGARELPLTADFAQ